MDRILGANTIDLGGGRRGFRGKDTVAGIPGTELAATWHNAVQETLMRAIEGTGQAAGAAETQLLQAISTGLYLGLAGGSANALTATILNSVIFPALVAGMRFTIKFGATANNGAATLDLTGFAVDPPAIAIVRNDNGAALEGGELVGFGELLFDGVSFRLLNIPRLRTPRVAVGAGGVTITAADEYTTFVMPLGTRQVFTLPACNSLPIGFRCTLETSGSPSGFQTSYVNVTGGGTVTFRASAKTQFFLIGNGEVFEFVNTGATWLTRLVSQPLGGIGVLRAPVGQPATVALPASWTGLVVNGVSGTSALYGQPDNSSIRLPVSGVYIVSAKMQVYNNTSAWAQMDLMVFDNTVSLLPLYGDTQPAYNSHVLTPSVIFSSYFEAGTVLLIAGQCTAGTGIYQGATPQFSAYLQGR